MKKHIDLELAYEFLGEEPPSQTGNKKNINAAKKHLKECRERYPVSIEIGFKLPWWANQEILSE